MAQQVTDVTEVWQDHSLGRWTQRVLYKFWWTFSVWTKKSRTWGILAKHESLIDERPYQHDEEDHIAITQLWLYAIDHVRSADGGWTVIVGFYESSSTTGFIDLIDHGLHTLLMSMTMCRLQQMAHRSSVVSVQVKADRLWPWLSERPTLIPKPIPLRYATRKDLEWTTHIWRLTKLVVVYSKQWMSSIMDAKCQQRTL